MATKLITAWINGSVQEIKVEVMDSGTQEPSVEDRLAYIERTHSPKVKRNVTLLANAWQGEVSPYSQVVEIDGVTKNSKIDLQLDADQSATFYEKEASFLAENDNGVVTVLCIGQKPLNDYTLQATMTEVIVDG